MLTDIDGNEVYSSSQSSREDRQRRSRSRSESREPLPRREPHIGQTINPTAFDVVGYCALNSPTLGAAFTRVARYHSIWTDGDLRSCLPAWLL